MSLEVDIKHSDLPLRQQPAFDNESSNRCTADLLSVQKIVNLFTIKQLLFTGDLDERFVWVDFLNVQNVCNRFDRQEVLANCQ